jgi:hypothetical protein
VRKRTSIRRRPSYVFYNIKILFREEWKLVTLIALFLSGMIIGSSAVNSINNEVNSRFVTLFSDYITMRSTQSIFDTFTNSLFVNLIYLGISFTAGLCAIGLPLIALSPFAKGVGIGMIAGYLYSSYAMTGAGFCLLIIFPGAIVATAALLFGCNESFVMSHELFNIVQGRAPNNYGNLIKKYSARYGILLILSVAASVIETLLTVTFVGKFNL